MHPDMETLLTILRGGAENWGELVDIKKLPQKLLEIERKYFLDHLRPGNINMAFMEALGIVNNLLHDDNIQLERMINFAGIDQYFILKKKGDIYTFRFRVGANRLPQLTVKVADERNSSRGEINLDVRHEKPEIVRAFMGVVARLADSYKLFTVQQSGIIWFLRDNRAPLEIVVYKTERLEPPSEIKCFLELEALDTTNVDEAINLIGKYEEKLGLKIYICTKSIGEMFAPEESFKIV